MAGKRSWVVLSAISTKTDGREEKLGGTLSNIYQERWPGRQVGWYSQQDLPREMAGKRSWVVLSAISTKREMAGKTSWVVLSARSAKRDGREEKLGGTLSNIYQERDGREDKLGGTLSNIFQERWTGRELVIVLPAMEKVLDENQPHEQAGFRKKYFTVDHLQALNQVIEKSEEYQLPPVIGFIDYEKAFDSIEHFSIFEALRKINVNETYVKILESIYKGATARVHLDNHVSEPFAIERGVRQGDPISPKLFTAVIEEVFKKKKQI